MLFVGRTFLSASQKFGFATADNKVCPHADFYFLFARYWNISKHQPGEYFESPQPAISLAAI